MGPVAGTLMPVDPDAPKVAQFITFGGEPYIIRNNIRRQIYKKAANIFYLI
jgi:ecotin